ncbi:hypothetical protein TNCV_3752601 [Trichonephila clavipes]|nr:hypothetical protein TNCV_3752601 [Trichonephila clavipes]
MLYDYTACKRSLECLFDLGALGKSKSLYRFASSELRKRGVKITSGDWYPPLRYGTKKSYQLTGHVLGLQWLNTNPQPIRNKKNKSTTISDRQIVPI